MTRLQNRLRKNRPSVTLKPAWMLGCYRVTRVTGVFTVPHARARASTTRALYVFAAESWETFCNPVTHVTIKHSCGFAPFLICNRFCNRVTEGGGMGKDGKRGSMRDSMPFVAACIDNLREAFGADQIDPSIRAGMRGEAGKFWAREGGHELGTPPGQASVYVWRKQ